MSDIQPDPYIDAIAAQHGSEYEPGPYVAPATKIFTQAHITAEDGTTACGLAMDESEIWLPVTLHDGDPVCSECTHPGSTQQQALL